MPGRIEARQDRLLGLDLLQRHRRAGGRIAQQVAQCRIGALVHQAREHLVVARNLPVFTAACSVATTSGL
jgi:hypothetical protein